MTPKTFLSEIVEPTLAEAEVEPLEMRRVILAIAVVDMLAAHIFHSRVSRSILWGKSDRQDDTGFRSLLARKNQDFALVRDIAKAQKHVILVQGSPLVSDAAAISARPLGFGQGAYGEGPYGGGQQIVAQLANGTMRNVIAATKAAVSFLKTEM